MAGEVCRVEGAVVCRVVGSKEVVMPYVVGWVGWQVCQQANRLENVTERVQRGNGELNRTVCRTVRSSGAHVQQREAA